MKEQIHDIDAMDNEDYAYYRGKTRDLSTAKWKTADEMPFIKAYQEKNPEKEIIKLGIGDVTRPIPKAVAEAMKNAVD